MVRTTVHAVLAAAAAVAAAAATASGAAAAQSVPVTVTVDATAAGEPFEHTWKRSWGSGHAALTLREDWRAHLKLAVEQLGLQGVRYHGLFDDDQGPVVPAPGVYNFTLLDSTWDYMISLGVTPIVELSFMPAWLANCSWQGKVGGPNSSSPIINVNPNGGRCTGHTFAYRGISQPPYNDVYTEWSKLVMATVEHAVARYGLNEIRKWSFEVWNELWGMPFPSEYMKLYNASSHAVKSVDSGIRVGGPATAGLEFVSEFVKEAKRMNAPFDFVSTHHYPSDPSCPSGADWDPTCFTNDVQSARDSVAEYPFYLTEYNVGCCLGYPQHDVPAAAAFVFRQIGELSQKLDVMSYWTFTDVFEEGGFPDTEFKDIYGSMTKSGIPKPVWRAFQLLHQHAGDRKLKTTLVNGTYTKAVVGDSCSLVPQTCFYGGDLLPNNEPLVVPDAASCCEACKNHSGTSPETKCWRWSWADEKSDCCAKRCYLKQLNGGQPRHSSTFTSGYSGAAPPPPPPPAPKEQLSAFATSKSSSTGIDGVRVFLGYWGNPDQDESNPPANRSVTVELKHQESQSVSSCTASIIGAGFAEPRALWESMGSPPTPDAKQLKKLMAASEFGTVAVPVTAVTGGTKVTVEMPENSAVVLAFA